MVECITQDVDEIARITIDTVDELVTRGELLDDLVDKTERLSEASEGMLWTVRQTLNEGIARRALRITKTMLRGVVALLYRFVLLGVMAGRVAYGGVLFLFPNEKDITDRLAQREAEVEKGEKIF
jgi:hypothetical protein